MLLGPPGYAGHAHFWEHALSRRQFIGASALVVGASVAWPSIGFAESEDGRKGGNADPNPIPGGTAFLGPGTQIFHANFPVFGNEVSTITDFSGSTAAAEIRGTGTSNMTPTSLFYDADMRFMSGKYTSVDGRTREGTFGFV